MPPPLPPQSQASQICAAESLCLTVSGSTSNISFNLIWTLRYSKISRACGADAETWGQVKIGDDAPATARRNRLLELLQSDTFVTLSSLQFCISYRHFQ